MPRVPSDLTASAQPSGCTSTTMMSSSASTDSCQASVAAYAKRMETLEAAAARSREAHLEAIDDVKARVAEKTEAARASFDAAVPAHAEDLRVKDAVARLCEKARRDLRDLLARSDADAAALEREMREIERVGEKNAPRLAGPASSSSLAVGTLGALDRARRLLLARCAFLGLVAESSTFAHEEAMAPYIALEASREVTPPSEEEVRAKEEAAKAAEAVRAASATLERRVTDDAPEGEPNPTMLSRVEALGERLEEAVVGRGARR